MKNPYLKLAGTLALFLFTGSTFAQNWELGGNDAFPPNAVNATNNILGTAAGTNLPLRFNTNGFQRMTIVGAGPTAGFVGTATL